MKNKFNRGFTLIELVVTIVIMILLVGIAVPAIGTLQDDAKIAKILATAEAAKTACERHYADTSLYAREQSGSSNPSWHRLSKRQETKGWKGPYLDRPLDSTDNPLGGSTIIYSSFNGGIHKLYGNEFRLTGPSAPRRRGHGNFIAFDKVSQKVAEGVNAALDSGISGNWKRYGRVQWRSTRGGTLMIYLIHGR